MRLLRWLPPPEHASGEDATSEGGFPEAPGATEGNSAMFSWSSSPTLQKICQGLEEQQRIIEELKRYLEERLSPFQRHLAEQRVSADHALRHLERRLKPLRQYIQGEAQNLERVMAHLEAGLRDQFEDFEELLGSQRGLLDKANRYIEEQPRPVVTYLEDGRRVIEMIYRDLEDRFQAFLKNLAEQQQILDSLREPGLVSEYEALAEYLEERQKALAQYARSGEYRPAELFAQLEQAANRCKPLHPGRNSLFARVFEEARSADQRLREGLAVPEFSAPETPEEEQQQGA